MNHTTKNNTTMTSLRFGGSGRKEFVNMKVEEKMNAISSGLVLFSPTTTRKSKHHKRHSILNLSHLNSEM